jgi:gliding motility-associated-like protein
MKRILLRFLFSLLLFAFTIGPGFSQVSVTTANFVYLQDFNSYSGLNINTVSPWTIGGNFSSYRGPGNGTSNSGGSWAYGIGTERALGYLGSNASSSINYGIAFVNNTGSPITQLEISYDFEQWRFESGNTLGWNVTGTGSLSSMSLAGLNSISVNVGVDGTVQATPKSIVLSGLNLLPNATFGIQWSCNNGAGSDNGIAIDNFRLAVICAPNIVSADTTLCSGESFVLNGSTYTTNQIVSDTLLAANGCDSVVNYNLNFLPAITHSLADTICAGTTYSWGSQNLISSGSYNQTFTSATNCDSVVTLNLFIRPAIIYTFADTTCAGATYSWGSQPLTTTGSYNQAFTSSANCDSVVTLNLFVRPAISYSFADTICAAITYNWGTQSLTTSGTYNQNFTSSTNCDSVVTLNLFVRPAISYSFADTICAAITYNWGTQSLTTSGTYNQNFTSSTNCDSVVTLNLFVRPAITYAFADTTCAGITYNWGSQVLTTSGTYSQNFTSSTNCDSVVTLNLFVRPAITYAFADTTCAGTTYNWGSQNPTTSGSYNQTFTSSTNCDSVVTLNLFVRPAITHTFADTICAGITYNWGSQALTTSGTYNQTFTSSTNCDSIVNLSLFIHPVITYDFADTTCAGTNYNWGTLTLANTGIYNQTFISITNCDSVVTLNLFVRSSDTTTDNQSICSGTSYMFGTQLLTTPGIYSEIFQDMYGCDSTVSLTLNVSSVITDTITASICAGSTYNWGSQSLNATGAYSQTFTSASSCDSIVTLNLLVSPVITNAFADTICAATIYNWGAQTFTTSGTYNQTFNSSTSCDSIVTLNLFVRPAITYAFADTICAAAIYNWGSQNPTTSGSYNQTFTSSTNCDSVVTLNLFVRPAITYAFADTTCAGATYNWGSQALTTSGSYNQTFTSFSGCDSIVTLNLLVSPVITNTIVATICAGATYNWSSQSLTTTGSYNQTFISAAGCDSIVTLNLLVNPTITNAIAASICAGATYNWGSQSLTATGSYNQTFTSAANCDSIVTLNLTVDPLLTDTLNEVLCFGQTFTLGSQVLSTSGTYSQIFPAVNGCDSLVVLHLTVYPLVSDTVAASICHGTTYTLGSQSLFLSGYYSEIFTSATGCDSIVTLNLQVSPQPVAVTIDTAACGTVWFEGISYTSSIILTDTFSSALGCDSLYRIVNINPHPNNPVVQVIDTASCGSLVFDGNLYTESITLADTIFNQLGCDSIVRTINIVINSAETQTIVHEMCAGSSFTFNGQQHTVAGSYPFSFKNQVGCDSLVILELIINPLPEIEIIKDNRSSYCVGDSIILQASGAQFYSWIYDDVDTLEGDYFSTILFSYKNAFSVVGVDNNGCRNTTSIRIDAQACCNIWMPNAFSPNADGMNDVFKPEAKGHPKEYVMYIYNRWGQTVYATFNIDQGWDGNINGKPADIADYYYRISGKCVNGEAINLKGVCTLIR